MAERRGEHAVGDRSVERAPPVVDVEIFSESERVVILVVRRARRPRGRVLAEREIMEADEIRRRVLTLAEVVGTLVESVERVEGAALNVAVGSDLLIGRV